MKILTALLASLALLLTGLAPASAFEAHDDTLVTNPSFEDREDVEGEVEWLPSSNRYAGLHAASTQRVSFQAQNGTLVHVHPGKVSSIKVRWYFVPRNCQAVVGGRTPVPGTGWKNVEWGWGTFWVAVYCNHLSTEPVSAV